MEKIRSRMRYDMEIVDSYSTDILDRNSVAKDIIEFFASISNSVYNIDYSNSEGYTDSFHKEFKTIDDFRLFSVPDSVIVDHVNFAFSIENNTFVVVLSFETGTISIFRDKDVDVDFLPLLNDMEQKIKQKKTNGMKM